jgi:hypothetical protein
MPSKTLTLEMPDPEAIDAEAAVKNFIAKIDRSLERNKRTQARIDKLKVETREILARLKAQMR